MARKFNILNCSLNEETNSYVVNLCPLDDQTLGILLPMSEEDALITNFLITPDKVNEIKPNLKLAGIYKTMSDGFDSSGTFISGIILSEERVEGEEVLVCNLYLSKIETGSIENFMKMQFSCAVILAAMNDVDIFITDELLSKIMPQNNNNEPENSDSKPIIDKTDKFPVDKKILKMAKKIMSGKQK